MSILKLNINNNQNLKMLNHTYTHIHHYFHTHSVDFIEKYLGIKLYPWQKITLKYFLKGDKNINAKTASRYISRR